MADMMTNPLSMLGMESGNASPNQGINPSAGIPSYNFGLPSVPPSGNQAGIPVGGRPPIDMLGMQGVPAGTPSQAGGGGMIDWSGLGPSYSLSTGKSSGGSSQSGSSKSSSYAGIRGPARDTLMGLIGTGPGSMPAHIDSWANSLMNNYRVTGEDTVRAMNEAANRRAAQGILGGTEANDLRASLLAKLAENVQQQRGSALSQAMGLKAEAVPRMLQLAHESVSDSESASSGGSSSQSDNFSFSTSPDDFRIVADLIQLGYAG